MLGRREGYYIDLQFVKQYKFHSKVVSKMLIFDEMQYCRVSPIPDCFGSRVYGYTTTLLRIRIELSGHFHR
jgi:hypothetical protein